MAKYALGLRFKDTVYGDTGLVKALTERLAGETIYEVSWSDPDGNQYDTNEYTEAQINDLLAEVLP